MEKSYLKGSYSIIPFLIHMLIACRSFLI